MHDAPWRQGLQLAAAVVLSYLVSAALRLPESFWAVMSALIVMRPSAGSTLGAGWDRVRGTVVGAAVGLAAVWLQHRLAFGGTPATLGVVALLALATAWRPAMRSAPIAALIVLSGGGMAGHAPLEVAGLRVAEIAVGVASGLAISLTGLRARPRARFDAACAVLLRRIAVKALLHPGPTAARQDDKEADAGALRLALRDLAVLAAGVDREAKFWRRLRRRSQDDAADCAGTARLIARIASDAALFARLASSAPLARDDVVWTALREAVAHALTTAADHIERQAAPDFTALRRFASDGLRTAAPIPWIAPAARLLVEDLTGLARRADPPA